MAPIYAGQRREIADGGLTESNRVAGFDRLLRVRIGGLGVLQVRKRPARMGLKSRWARAWSQAVRFYAPLAARVADRRRAERIEHRPQRIVDLTGNLEHRRAEVGDVLHGGPRVNKKHPVGGQRRAR